MPAVSRSNPPHAEGHPQAHGSTGVARMSGRPVSARPVAIITGASAGIGAATALRIAEAGYSLLLVARRTDRLQQVAQQCRQRGGPECQVELLEQDVAAAGASARILDAAQAHFGRFDVVFANAGYGLERSMTELPIHELRQMFDTNFFSSVELCTLAAQRLEAAGRGGHLLMCSSCVAKFTLPEFGAYSASKAAQAHVARAMAYELRPKGIHVSSVHPVTTSTEFFDVVRERSNTSAAAAGTASKPTYDIHNMSRFFVQHPDKVARAVVRALRRPRTEVWTSLSTRFAAAVITAFPGMLDFAVRMSQRRR